VQCIPPPVSIVLTGANQYVGGSIQWGINLTDCSIYH
jgi:hypothetical protein